MSAPSPAPAPQREGKFVWRMAWMLLMLICAACAVVGGLFIVYVGDGGL